MKVPISSTFGDTQGLGVKQRTMSRASKRVRRRDIHIANGKLQARLGI